MSKTFNRRILLRGLGGAVVAAPFLSSLAGRARRAGYFKTGWAVNVEGGKTGLTAGNSDGDCVNGNTLPNLDDAGTPPDQATMPINKYSCNLMNAIGVMGDSNGFPAKGGTAPVSCYGKYDDTTLFGTGEPAIIKNPGEYSELRAS